MKKTLFFVLLSALLVALIVGCDGSSAGTTIGTAEVLPSAGRPNNECGWVQLWEGGPKFATMNVGATAADYSNADEYSLAFVGGYYNWGMSSDRRTSTSDLTKCLSLSDIQGTSDDTAKTLWGSNWNMPTFKDLCNLANRNSDGITEASKKLTEWEYCDGVTKQYVQGCSLAGYKVSGVQSKYKNNCIFIPMAGCYDDGGKKVNEGTYASYFTSTPLAQNQADLLGAGQDEIAVGEIDKNYGSSVLAILAEK